MCLQSQKLRESSQGQAVEWLQEWPHCWMKRQSSLQWYSPAELSSTLWAHHSTSPHQQLKTSSAYAARIAFCSFFLMNLSSIDKFYSVFCNVNRVWNSALLHSGKGTALSCNVLICLHEGLLPSFCEYTFFGCPPLNEQECWKFIPTTPKTFSGILWH